MSRFVGSNHAGDEFTTGGATGYDDAIGLSMYARFSSALHRVVLPANHSQLGDWWRPFSDVITEQMPEGTDYRDRNDRILDHTDVLYALPTRPEACGTRDGGTWMTVRLARKRGLPIYIVTRDGIVGDAT